MVLHHPLTGSQFIICEAAQLSLKQEKRRGGGSLGSALPSAANFLLPPQVMISLHFNLITHTPHSYLPPSPALYNKKKDKNREGGILKQSSRLGWGPQATAEVRCEWSSWMNGNPLSECGALRVMHCSSFGKTGPPLRKGTIGKGFWTSNICLSAGCFFNKSQSLPALPYRAN